MTEQEQKFQWHLLGAIMMNQAHTGKEIKLDIVRFTSGYTRHMVVQINVRNADSKTPQIEKYTGQESLERIAEKETKENKAHHVSRKSNHDI